MSITPAKTYYGRNTVAYTVHTLGGSTFDVIRYGDGDVGLYGGPDGADVDAVLNPEQARQLRKALKKALRP